MADRVERALRLVEGEACTKTFTVRKGGALMDLSGATITLYGHDAKADKGTNLWSLSGSVLGPGVFSVAFSVANTTAAESGDDIKGTVRAQIDYGTANDRWTKAIPLVIEANDHIS